MFQILGFWADGQSDDSPPTGDGDRNPKKNPSLLLFPPFLTECWMFTANFHSKSGEQVVAVRYTEDLAVAASSSRKTKFDSPNVLRYFALVQCAYPPTS